MTATETKPLDLSPFDAFEVHPLVLLEDQDYETCERDDPNLHCWGVYGHRAGVGITSLCDCATEEQAEEIAALFEQVNKGGPKLFECANCKKHVPAERLVESFDLGDLCVACYEKVCFTPDKEPQVI